MPIFRAKWALLPKEPKCQTVERRQARTDGVDFSPIAATPLRFFGAVEVDRDPHLGDLLGRLDQRRQLMPTGSSAPRASARDGDLVGAARLFCMVLLAFIASFGDVP
jgi:hypothetical protein